MNTDTKQFIKTTIKWIAIAIIVLIYSFLPGIDLAGIFRFIVAVIAITAYKLGHLREVIFFGIGAFFGSAVGYGILSPTAPVISALIGGIIGGIVAVGADIRYRKWKH